MSKKAAKKVAKKANKDMTEVPEEKVEAQEPDTIDESKGRDVEQDRLSALEADYKELKRDHEELKRELRNSNEHLMMLDAMCKTMQKFMPERERPITLKEYDEIIQSDPRQEFRVLKEFKKCGVILEEGNQVCQRRYKHLRSHLTAGLQLSVKQVA